MTIQTDNKKKQGKIDRLIALREEHEAALAAADAATAKLYKYFSTAHKGTPSEKMTLAEIVAVTGVSKPTICRHLDPSAKRDS